jgi:hypothetical protein
VPGVPGSGRTRDQNPCWQDGRYPTPLSHLTSLFPVGRPSTSRLETRQSFPGSVCTMSPVANYRNFLQIASQYAGGLLPTLGGVDGRGRPSIPQSMTWSRTPAEGSVRRADAHTGADTR